VASGAGFEIIYDCNLIEEEWGVVRTAFCS
jgi:hypothetical protein